MPFCLNESPKILIHPPLLDTAMSSEEVQKQVEFNGYTYVPNNNFIQKLDASGKEISHIKTGEIVNNKLYSTKEGIYFKVHDIYFGLQHDERVRQVLYLVDAEDQLHLKIQELLIYEITFVLNSKLCSLNSNLIYEFDGTDFIPTGSARLSLAAYERLLVLEDVSVIPQPLFAPDQHIFEYTTGNKTFTYLDKYVFVSDENKRIVERLRFKYELKNIMLNYVQTGDVVYGLSGDFWHVQQLVMIKGPEFKVIKTYPVIQVQNFKFITEGNDVYIEQFIGNNVEEYYNEQSERVLTYLNGDKPSEVYVRYKLNDDKQEYHNLSVDNIAEVVPPIKSSDKIHFYCSHAVTFDGNKRVTNVIQLPTLINPAETDIEIDTQESNTHLLVDGYDYDLSVIGGLQLRPIQQVSEVAE